MIADYFPQIPNSSKLTFNNDILNKFLERFNLKSKFQSPHENIVIYEDIDIFLKDSFEKSDVILAYDLADFQKRETESEGHVSLVKEFDFPSRIITLSDALLDGQSFPLRDFVRNMNPWKNENYGFYIISDK